MKKIVLLVMLVASTLISCADAHHGMQRKIYTRSVCIGDSFIYNYNMYDINTNPVIDTVVVLAFGFDKVKVKMQNKEYWINMGYFRHNIKSISYGKDTQ